MGKNNYKANKFKKVKWEAVVYNDTDKDIATLSFTKNFYEAAQNLKARRKEVNDQFKIVKKQMTKIINDSKTGSVHKRTLERPRDYFETARGEFLTSTKALYDAAINKYNEWLQKVYDEFAKSQLTNVGTAETVKSENIAADDNADVVE